MISAILLAAGQSKRMGGENKLIKTFRGKCLINHILKSLIKSRVTKIIIVLGYESFKVKKKLLKSKKIKFVYNKSFKSGMASSIKAGLKKISKKDSGFLVVQGDMPFVSKTIINSLCSSIKRVEKEIFIPFYKKKAGNPIGFKTSFLKFLRKIKGDSGAKRIIRSHKKKIYKLKIQSNSILRDFDNL